MTKKDRYPSMTLWNKHWDVVTLILKTAKTIALQINAPLLELMVFATFHLNLGKGFLKNLKVNNTHGI